jgi:hypothetical protein
MNKYPLDNVAVQESVRDLLLHDQAQAKLIQTLSEAVAFLIDSDPDVDDEWIEELQELLVGIKKRKFDFENHRFNQGNGHHVTQKSPYENTPETLASIGSIDLMTENKLNAMEKELGGGEMSEEELAKHFGEPKPRKKKEKAISKMSLEEIESWEAAQDNSNDIYKVSARIKNAARMAVKANLTPQGDMIANTFTHVVKGIYDLADTVSDKETKMKLTKFARSQEEGAAGLISALSSGVRAPT